MSKNQTLHLQFTHSNFNSISFSAAANGWEKNQPAENHYNGTTKKKNYSNVSVFYCLLLEYWKRCRCTWNGPTLTEVTLKIKSTCNSVGSFIWEIKCMLKKSLTLRPMGCRQRALYGKNECILNFIGWLTASSFKLRFDGVLCLYPITETAFDIFRPIECFIFQTCRKVFDSGLNKIKRAI